MFIDKSFNDSFGIKSYKLSNYLAVLYKNESGNAVDSKGYSQLLLGVYVDLTHLNIASALCNSLDRGSDNAARAASFCPEIKQNGLVTINYLSFKI